MPHKTHKNHLMKKTPLAIILLASCVSAFCVSATSPFGYNYGQRPAPLGNEWEQAESLALNKLTPRAVVLGAEQQSLAGDWRFNWVPTPDKRPADFYKPGFDASAWDVINVPSNWNIIGLQKDGSQKYGTPIYVNQPVIFMHEIKPGDWKKGVMREPPKSWTTYANRNEVGSYLKNFTVPEGWMKDDVYIVFDGVDSFFYLWINGQYVGFSKNSRNAARFDITPYIKKGENTVAVEVYRNSDGSFLEAQDMFRLPGIFRDVRIEARPKINIADIRFVTRQISASEADAEVTVLVRNNSTKKSSNLNLEVSLTGIPLYGVEAQGEKVSVGAANIPALLPGEEKWIDLGLTVKNPRLWSAEEPNRYLLAADLTQKKKVLDQISLRTGLRTVEIRDVAAADDEFGQGGRFFLVNGQPVKLRGVNRHETNPAKGHAIDTAQMRREVMEMKRLNINHVRNSHYPAAPYWYELCDRFGIYLTDEANVESHEYFYGDASLSHPREWEAAHVDRNLAMVKERFNAPSVVIWSMGNEAGPGKNFTAARDAIKAIDTSRPVHYERNNDIADFGSNQYPSIAWTREAVKGNAGIKYPFYISEYAHSMGNAVGNLVDYWDAINSSNHLLGGAIWDWVDQSLYNYDKATGERYLAYGGDFGDTPNDGQFVMNGIMFGDLTHKPQAWEVKKVYQPMEMSLHFNENQWPDTLVVKNRNYFSPVKDYDIVLDLKVVGYPMTGLTIHGSKTGEISPRGSIKVPVAELFENINGYNFSDARSLYPDMRLTARVKDLSQKPWHKNKGEVIAAEQFEVIPVGLYNGITGKPEEPMAGSVSQISGNPFEIKLNPATGQPMSLKVNGKEMLKPGTEISLNPFRAFVNNDNWLFASMYANGLNNLQHKCLNIGEAKLASPDGDIRVISATVESRAPYGYKIYGGTSTGHNRIEAIDSVPFTADDLTFITNYVWTLTPNGKLSLRAVVNSNKPSANLGRIGLAMELNPGLDNLYYYGRGPKSNYPDRKSSQFIDMYKSTVQGEYDNFTKPQNTGNHTDTYFVEFYDESVGNEEGFSVSSRQPFNFTAIPYTEADLVSAPHPYQLPKEKRVIVHLDKEVTGLGGNSCGQGPPLAKDRVKAGLHNLSFDFDLPESANKLMQKGDQAVSPLNINRDRSGLVTINLPGVECPVMGKTINPVADILYSVNGGKPMAYKGAFDLRKGGEVRAWYKNMPQIKSIMTFPVQESIVAEVVFASSDEGGTAANLTDGDPTTNWYTVYSKTVGTYPHWVDLDAGMARTLKGIVFQPRTSRGWGDIKDYEIYISQDGTNWGEPVLKGSMEWNVQPKKLLFAKPLKGRYVRFKALCAHDGHDYASAAEISILAD